MTKSVIFWYVAGRFCQCDTSKAESTDTTTCQRPGTGEVCSGKGKCDCGSCDCTQGYTGQCCQIKMSRFCAGENDQTCSGTKQNYVLHYIFIL